MGERVAVSEDPPCPGQLLFVEVAELLLAVPDLHESAAVKAGVDELLDALGYTFGAFGRRGPARRRPPASRTESKRRS
jgi:hypothetical protein